MRRGSLPTESPPPNRLSLLDALLLAAAAGCIGAIVLADRLHAVKPALAFWGAACVALVAVNFALRAAFEATALRKRVRDLEEHVVELERQLARTIRGDEPDRRSGADGEGR